MTATDEAVAAPPSVPDPRPLGGYATLLATYGTGASLLAFALRGRRGRIGRIDARELVLLTLATQHISRILTKDSITSPLRAPFARFVQATGEGEVLETVIGHGVRHAVGELATCPYCSSQWVATALLAGTVAAPNLTGAVTRIAAISRVSDFLQLAYDRMKNDG